MKKLAGALLVVLMIAAGLLFSASPASAQDETEDEPQGEIGETQTTEGELAGLSQSEQDYLDLVETWARRGAEAGRDQLQSQIDTAVEELQERLQTLEGRLEVREGAQWLPEFCLRWMTELNKSNAIDESTTITNENEVTQTTPAGGEGGGTNDLTDTTTETQETSQGRTLAGQLLKSRVGAMLILIVNGVELCALKVDLR